MIVMLVAVMRMLPLLGTGCPVGTSCRMISYLTVVGGVREVRVGADILEITAVLCMYVEEKHD